MSRKSRSSRSNRRTSRSRRVVNNNAKRSLPRTRVDTRQYDLIDFIDRFPVEDRRTFHPEMDMRPARSYRKSNHTLVVASPPSPVVLAPDKFAHLRVPTGVAFQHPNDVLICVRRKQRKEVLHALKKAGKSGQKSPRRSAFSDIHC